MKEYSINAVIRVGIANFRTSVFLTACLPDGTELATETIPADECPRPIVELITRATEAHSALVAKVPSLLKVDRGN